MASDFESINKIKAANDISKRTGEALTSEVGFRNHIDFENAVLKNQKRVKDEQKLYYKLNMFKHKGYFNILNKISEHVTLAQLMDSTGNVQHAISVVGCWKF